MKKEIICGIYKITNPKGRIYIGQSKDINSRHNAYKGMYKTVTDQRRLYRSIIKHGWDNHTFEILEECLKENLDCCERFWQDTFDVTGKMGMNCMLTKCDDTKGTMPDKMYEIIAKQLINIHTKEVYRSISHAAEMLNINRRALSRELQRPISNQTIVMFLSEYREDLDFSNDPVDFQKRIVIRVSDKKIFDSIREAAKSLGWTCSRLGGKLRNKTNNDSGFLFIEDYQTGEQPKEPLVAGTEVINIETREEFTSIKEVAKTSGINYSTLRSWLNPNSPKKNTSPFRYKRDITD